jgi:hypothetical protein
VNPVLLSQIEYKLHHVIYGFVVALRRLDLEFVGENCTPVHLRELIGDRLGVSDHRLQYFDSVPALSVLNLEMELLILQLIDLGLVCLNLTPQIPIGLHERLHHLD